MPISTSTMRVGHLSRTEKSLVAIARALAADCDFLVLDEPTASLPADEVERLFAALRPLKARGVGMIYVSHRLDEIFRIADRVAVLRDGQMVGVRRIDETDARRPRQPDRRPEDARDQPPAGPCRAGDPDGPRPRDAACRPGQPSAYDAANCSGSSGLRGAGHEDIGRALFGAMPHRGTVTLDGAAPDLATPQSAMRSGIGLVARDRVHESIAPGLTIRENAYLNPSATGRALLSFLAPRRETGDGARDGPATSGCRPTIRRWRSRRCRAATSRRWSSGRWLDADRRAADRRGSDGRRRCRRQGRDLSPAVRGAGLGDGRAVSFRPISRRSPISATAPSSSAAGCSWPN